MHSHAFHLRLFLFFVTISWVAAARPLEVLLANAPVASAPRASMPRASVPVASTPRPSTHIASAPRASAPVTSMPRASAPRASAPVTSVPRASAPRASAPVTSVPRASAPRASAPVKSVPRASAPVANAPRANAPRSSGEVDFIRLSCMSTLYPDVCYKFLSPYKATIQTSPFAMAFTALNMTLEATNKASMAVLKIFKEYKLGKREASAVEDCVETVEDAVDELKRSMEEMTDLEGPEFQFKVSNIQTWVSAALTDDTTCMDGIEEKVNNEPPTTNNEMVKRLVRDEIVNVEQLTSVALALINKLT